ncbi:butyrate kinase [Oleidesulfovibrio sp.]|uniref:butyrate kinase n=1 Tax=Oleidesulfovibrio sp. TaxID=2909707 RepID=UPI003A87595E
MSLILTINPGSTSTKVALYEDETSLFEKTVEHTRSEFKGLACVFDQLEARRKAVATLMSEAGFGDVKLDIVVGRGGLLAPMHGGAWRITQPMLDDLSKAAYGEHPCNLGAPLALAFAVSHGAGSSTPAIIVDPVVTDELDDIARVGGLPELPRRSVFHALSQRAAARRAASQLGMKYEEGCFLVGHFGGGISIGAHRNGRVVDVNNALEGEGPFSPERTGGLPVMPALELVRNGMYSFDEMRNVVQRAGGMWAHLGTNDLREVQRRMDEGDRQAALIFDALAYNSAKALCALAPALIDPAQIVPSGAGNVTVTIAGPAPATSEDDPSCPAALDGGNDCDTASPVDAVVLTGGMARSERLMHAIGCRVRYLGPVVVLPELEEMQALALGGLRVLRGEETPAEYAA